MVVQKRTTDTRYCGGHTVVVFQLPKLIARVRFPSPALFLSLILLSGCATTEYPTLPQPSDTSSTGHRRTEISDAKSIDKPRGVYHKIAKGQTLWRIAKFYGVGVDEIIASNNIPNAAAVEVDQLILIPGATEVKDIPVRTAEDKTQEFGWPIKGRVISYFNDRKANVPSRGIHIDASEGDTVKAVREGTVVLADYIAGYGQVLCVDHGDGFMSVYAQNRKLLSKLGERVFKGDPIAEVGRKGRRAWVHFELRKGVAAVNPLYYLPS